MCVNGSVTYNISRIKIHQAMSTALFSRYSCTLAHFGMHLFAVSYTRARFPRAPRDMTKSLREKTVMGWMHVCLCVYTLYTHLKCSVAEYTHLKCFVADVEVNTIK